MEFILAILLTWALAGFVMLMIWIASKLAYAAFRKNRSYWTFFWLSLILSPILVGLVIAVLPFDDEDELNPRNIKKIKPDLAESLKSLATSVRAAKSLAVIAGAVSVIILISAAAQGISQINFGSSAEHTIKSPKVPQGTPVSNDETALLEKGLQQNCKELPGNIYTIANLDKVPGHYSVIAFDGSYGDFQVSPVDDGALIKALDSHLGYVAWGCDSIISTK